MTRVTTCRKFAICAIATVATAGTGTLLAAEPEEPAVAEVLVTATKRGAENIQSVPMAISAYSGDQLQSLGIESFSSIDLKTPGLVFTSNSGTVQPFIRGIGAEFPSSGLEAPVSVYVDDVYWQRAWGSNYDLVDLSTVQVLKGPQGTLYGRNATGGAILITTNDPSHKDEGKIFVETGSLDHVQTDVVLNKALTDRLAVRVSGRYTNQDGYLNNPVSGVSFGGFLGKTIRAKILYEGDAFNVLLSGGYTENTGLTGLRQAYLGAPLCVVCDLTGATPPRGRYTTYQGQDSPLRFHDGNVSLKITGNLGNLTITSITAADDAFQFSATDETGFSNAPPGQALNFEEFFIDHQTGKDVMQEFRIASHFSGRFNFLAGINGQYSDESIASRVTGAAFNGADLTALNNVKTTSAAPYAELYYNLTDALKLTVGGRYNYDRRTAESTPGGLVAAPTYPYTGSWKNFTPKVVFAYTPDESQNYYASYNTGFKSGGFNFPSFANSPTDILRPEKIRSYEVGAKNSFFGRRVLTTAAIFYYKYDDIQVSHVDSVRGSIKQNAGTAEGKGVELDGQFAVSEQLTLGLGYAYLHARFTDYRNASVFEPSSSGIGLQTAVLDLTGVPLPRAPDHTANANATYNFPLSSSWKGSLTGIARYTSAYDFNPDRGGPLGLDHQKAFAIVNLSGFVGPNDEKYKIGFYVDNVFDKLYYDLVTTTGLGSYHGPAAPRTYGANVTVNF
jgi:iron complex outermembrane recepter protein